MRPTRDEGYHIMDSTIVFLLILLALIIIPIIVKFQVNEKKKEKLKVKEEGRYYFYDDRCSFKLPKEEIMQDNVEKGGLKHTLVTNSMGMVIIEIRPCMPNFGGNPMITTKNMRIAGYPGLEASMMGITHQYYINCGSFVVQADNVSEEFLNSFRVERK